MYQRLTSTSFPKYEYQVSNMEQHDDVRACKMIQTGTNGLAISTQHASQIEDAVWYELGFLLAFWQLHPTTAHKFKMMASWRIFADKHHLF
ncbi:hypothetical protein HanRHA438_Chr02g0058511 [Helianthus annuus]|nr:hypothetical protein HanRHA438_Chr02g0058511 [Helianthus annuus]